MTASLVPLVQFSQESLYFPLPPKDIIIENIVQVKNLLECTEEKTENIIVFKVLCTVRNRYGVKPSVGFIFPTESVKIKFLLDLPQLRRQRGAEAALVLPDAKTQDNMFVDIAVLPKDQAKAYMESLNENRNGKKIGRSSSRMYVEQAAAFWKTLGQIKPGNVQVVRRQLSCVYGDKGVPESLVMRMGGYGTELLESPQVVTPSGSDAVSTPSPPAVPKSRFHTDKTDTRRKSPPVAPPRLSVAGSARNRDMKSPSTESGGVVSSPRAKNNLVPPTVLQNSGAGGGITPNSRPAAVIAHPTPALAQRKQKVWKECLCFRVSFRLLAALLVLSFLCALFESGTFLSWLLIGR
ncbi:hypothetical protein TcYC6_0076170 [Trypanosoma cruzi]|nr:hypothetical protein TcYC6_0076170 [Trypanosoma cruzi]